MTAISELTNPNQIDIVTSIFLIGLLFLYAYPTIRFKSVVGLLSLLLTFICLLLFILIEISLVWFWLSSLITLISIITAGMEYYIL